MNVIKISSANGVMRRLDRIDKTLRKEGINVSAAMLSLMHARYCKKYRNGDTRSMDDREELALLTAFRNEWKRTTSEGRSKVEVR